MTPDHRRFVTRLATLLVAALAVWLLGCRPAWSPDGTKLLYLVPAGKERIAVACHDRISGSNAVVFAPPGDAMATPLWAADGSHAMVLWGQQGGAGTPQLTTLDLTTGSPVHSQPLPTNGDAESAPVVVGTRVFLADDGLLRFDPRTGQTLRKAVPRTEQVTIAPFGDGLCYMATVTGNERRWEFGSLDPETLERTPLLTPPKDFPWRVIPLVATTADRQLIAFPARAVDEDGPLALLVFAGGAFETARPLGKHRDVDCGSLAWLPDGATLCAGLARTGNDAAVAWSLFETTRSGSATRETAVLRGVVPKGDRRPLGLVFPFAIAPDGRTAAASTAMLEGVAPEAHGLYLVDLASRRRTVARLPFPAPPPPITLRAADTLLDIARTWADEFAVAPDGRPLEASGGGATDAIASLVAGQCDLVLTTGPAPATALNAAAAAGVELVAHQVAWAALVLCVHPDNGVPSLTIDQLARLFGGTPERWHDFGVELPERASRVTIVRPSKPSHAHALLQEFGMRAAVATDGRQQRSPRDLTRRVRSRPGAITYMDFGALRDTLRTVPIVDKHGLPIAPDTASVQNGTYPLAKPVLLYARGGARPDVAAFLQWLQSDAGRAASTRAGLVAMPPR